MSTFNKKNKPLKKSKNESTKFNWQKLFEFLDQNISGSADNQNTELIFQSSNSKSVSLKLIVCTIITSYIILGILLFYLLPFEMEARGQFGDMFGVINGLISAFAFGALVYSIWIQRDDLNTQNQVLRLQFEELKLQRDELKLTREELAKTTDAQISSGIALTKQFNNMQRTIRMEALSKVVDIHKDTLNFLNNADLKDANPEYLVKFLNLKSGTKDKLTTAQNQLIRLTDEILIANDDLTMDSPN